MKKKRFALKLRTLLIIPIIVSLISWWAIDFYKDNTLLCKFLLRAEDVSEVEKPDSLYGGHDAAFIEFETYDLEFICIWDGKITPLGAGPGLGASGIRARSYYRWPVKVWIWIKNVLGIDLRPVK